MAPMTIFSNMENMKWVVNFVLYFALGRASYEFFHWIHHWNVQCHYKMGLRLDFTVTFIHGSMSETVTMWSVKLCQLNGFSINCSHNLQCWLLLHLAGRNRINLAYSLDNLLQNMQQIWLTKLEHIYDYVNLQQVASMNSGIGHSKYRLAWHRYRRKGEFS